MPYKSDKDRKDRLIAQRKYYYNHRKAILSRMKLKRDLNRKIEITREQGLLLDLYHTLKDYLQHENLID